MYVKSSMKMSMNFACILMRGFADVDALVMFWSCLWYTSSIKLSSGFFRCILCYFLLKEIFQQKKSFWVIQLCFTAYVNRPQEAYYMYMYYNQWNYLDFPEVTALDIQEFFWVFHSCHLFLLYSWNVVRKTMSQQSVCKK